MLLKMEDFLRKHPTIGFATSLWAFIQPFMDTLTPILQFIALVIGVMIGGITLRLKLMEYNEKKAKYLLGDKKDLDSEN